MVCYQNRVFLITIVTVECTVLLLQQYVFKVCAISFGFWSSCLKVYIHLLCINTHRRTTTTFYLWSSLSLVSLLYVYYKNTVLRLVWYRLVCIKLNIKFISVYKASTNSDKQQHHLLSLTPYHLATVKRWYCIRGQPIVVRKIVTPI